MKHPLAELREQKGWTQAQLGAILGVTGPRVASVERGAVPRAWIEHLELIKVIDTEFVARVDQWLEQYVSHLVNK